MFVSNTIKVVGCLMMLFGSHPLLAYAIVGLGAAAYSPAKYGILTELLPPSQLVKANGWIEGLTIALDHPRRAARRPAGRPAHGADAARLRPAAARHRHRHRARSGDRGHRLLYIVAARLQPATSRAPRRRCSRCAAASAAWCATSRTATRGCGPTSWARSRWPRRRCSGASRATCATSCFAWAAAALGYGTTQASSLVGVVAIGTAVGAVVASVRDAARPGDQRDPARHRDGRAGDRPELHRPTSGSPRRS